MAVARTVFPHAARQGEAPGLTLAGTNRGVLSEIPEGMVTMLYAMLDTQRGLLRIANAGHNYPVLINGHVSELELSGMPLGVDGDSEYDEATATLDYGDTVVLGSNEPIALPWEELVRRFSEPGVRADFARIQIDSPHELSTLLMADSEPLRAWIAGAPPANSDDHNWLERRMPLELNRRHRQSVEQRIREHFAPLRVPVLLCASGVNDRARLNSSGVPEHYPLNYVFNVGQYLIFNPVTRQDGGGAFAPNGRINPASILDGLSNTLGMAEVKGFNPRFHDVTSMPAAPCTSGSITTAASSA